MSLSSLERACPPSRRRSCLACTKAKRRCDNTLPACVRCRRRGVECLYPVRRSGDDKTGQGQNKSTGTDGYAFLPVQPCDLVLDGVSTATVPTVPVSPFDLDDYAQNFITAPVDTPIDTLINTQPLHLSAPLAAANWNFVARIVKSHLGHAMDIIRDAPRLFVHENRLPWSHPLLYRDSMPRSMEDALSSCALSLSKNAVNSPLILRTIDRRLHDLLDAPEPTTPLDCVAKTQALLLYNIIGIFDSDINARATVENTQPLLQRAARRLLSFITFDSLKDGQDADNSLLSSNSEGFWSSWILMESARRTFLISLYFMHLYCIVVGTPSRTCNERRYLNRYWTISASLWNSSSPDEFSRAWAQNRFFLARVGNFDELLAEARAEDIDDFSRIFLSSLMGIEEFSMWMAERGSSKAM